MEELISIKQKLKNNINLDMEFLFKECELCSNDDNGIEKLYGIICLMENIIDKETSNKFADSVFAFIIKNKKKIHNYFIKKVNSIFLRHEWSLCIEYINKILKISELKQFKDNNYQFASLVDTYIYSFLNAGISLVWREGCESWLLYKKGVCFEKLKNYHKALESYKLAMKYDPMAFNVAKEIIYCYKRIEQVEEMYNSILDIYHISYSKDQISVVLNSFAEYFLLKNNIDLAIACLSVSIVNDKSHLNAIAVENILAEIRETTNIGHFLYQFDKAKEKLLNAKIPFVVSAQMINAMAFAYNRLLRESKFKEQTKIIKNKLLEISNNDTIVIDIVDAEVKTPNFLHVNTAVGIKLYLNKQWTPKYKQINFLKNIVFSFENNNKRIELSVLNNKINKEGFMQLCQNYLTEISSTYSYKVNCELFYINKTQFVCYTLNNNDNNNIEAIAFVYAKEMMIALYANSLDEVSLKALYQIAGSLKRL